MTLLKLRLFNWFKDLGAVALVSVGVAMVFTVGASVVDQFHQVAAEDLGGNEIAAVSGGNNTQVLGIKEWGITLTLPLGSDMAMVKYATQGPDSVGLTSVGVEKDNPICTAGHNSVGVIVREPAGAPLGRTAQGQMSLGTVGDYTYAYERPDSPCESTTAAELASEEAMGIAGDAVLGAQ